MNNKCETCPGGWKGSDEMKTESKMIDLRKCKKGDKLRIRMMGVVGEGLRRLGATDIVTYNGLCDKSCPNSKLFPHMIEYSTGAGGTRTHTGTVFGRSRRPEDADVIEIIGKDLTK